MFAVVMQLVTQARGGRIVPSVELPQDMASDRLLQFPGSLPLRARINIKCIEIAMSPPEAAGIHFTWNGVE
jgi:hypothetical protein